MSDRGYTAGLLIGCVLLLSAGIAFTFFELREYSAGVPDPLGDVSVRRETAPAERRTVPQPQPEVMEEEETDREPEPEMDDSEEDAEVTPEPENGQDDHEDAADRQE